MVTYYKSLRIGKDRKPGWRIVDDSGKIVNMNPSKKDLRCLGEEPYIVNRKNMYTNDELLNDLRRFVRENGLVPGVTDFVNNPEYPSFATYQKQFGSWSRALALAGLGKYTYTDKQLLNYLRQFYDKNDRVPTEKDFVNNPEYPSYVTYQRQFGNWSKALKLVGLDIETTVKRGIVQNNQQKGRLWEISVIEHFENRPKDLSGENYHSPCDGICPNGQAYEVKSSKLHEEKYWIFNTANKYKEEIEIYYFGAFNSDWTKLEYGWRVPGEIVENDMLYVGMSYAKFNEKI